MTDDFEKLFSPKTVCQVLVAKGMITKAVAEDVIKKYSSIKAKLEKARMAINKMIFPNLFIVLDYF